MLLARDSLISPTLDVRPWRRVRSSRLAALRSGVGLGWAGRCFALGCIRLASPIKAATDGADGVRGARAKPARSSGWWSDDVALCSLTATAWTTARLSQHGVPQPAKWSRPMLISKVIMYRKKCIFSFNAIIENGQRGRQARWPYQGCSRSRVLSTSKYNAIMRPLLGVPTRYVHRMPHQE